MRSNTASILAPNTTRSSGGLWLPASCAARTEIPGAAIPSSGG